MLLSRLVAADAVPPPPRECPKGKIGITSHHGPECVEPAPTNCPVGWRGVIRGLCVVETCTTDESCGAGRQCKEADVCQHEFLQEWGWGALVPPPPSPDALACDPFVLAGPPQRFDPPRKVIETVDICAADRTCPPESTCQKGRVCLPKDAKKPAAWKGKKK